MNLHLPASGTRTLEMDVELVLKGQGVPAGARPGEAVIEAARRAADEAPSLLAPSYVQSALQVESRRPTAVLLSDGTVLDGEAIAVALACATQVVAVVCTIGPAVDRQVSLLLSTNPLLALAFDGLGSAACERLADELCAEIAEHAARAGNRVTGPLCPGMIGWPLHEGQRQVFALVNPAPIGVVLTSSGQMIPRKTLSFVVGIGAHVAPHASCPTCGVSDRCKYRPNND